MTGNWTNDQPTKVGRYWFYGDIFWGGMNRPPEDFKPQLEIVEVFQVSNGLAASCCSEFVSLKKCQGVFWSEPMETPIIPTFDIGLPEKRG